jgi:NAD(P)-dependent dehydrogenase (short-subunit alcohol dehydrogenase family)
MKRRSTLMDTAMQGKIALITGAAGDIGSTVARRFAAEGMRLALVDRDQDRLTDLASRLRQGGSTVSTALTDLSMSDSIGAVVEGVLIPYGGRVDVLINNAGICPALQIEQILDPRSLPTWRAVYDVNFYGYLLMMMSVLPIMAAQGGGVILNNASDLARQPLPEMLHYSTAKAAVVHVTQGLAHHVGQLNIRLVAVAPGPTRTSIWTREGGLMDFYASKYNLPREEALHLELLNRGLALPRLIEPEEIASLMVYLASPQAASITRCVIDINGGSHQAY